MAVRITDPGLQTTVQDLGRPGLSHIGVARSGAADTLSLRIGNRLVGNPDAAAALEMTLRGGEYLFEQDGLVAVTGAPAPIELRGAAASARAVPMWRAAHIRAGERLVIGPTSRGARGYLCIAGGIDTEPVLGSRATHLASGIGGLDGRALSVGDVLPIGAPRADAPHTPSKLDVFEDLFLDTLRVTPGPHVSLAGGVQALTHTDFTVSASSDRMGVRLEGPRLHAAARGRMITEGMPDGAIQVPESGQPIILLPDRPTTGGYPVIACIASVDLPACGQLRPWQRIRFELITIDEARRLYQEREALLDRVLPPVLASKNRP
jgi:antagonist of KipI